MISWLEPMIQSWPKQTNDSLEDFKHGKAQEFAFISAMLSNTIPTTRCRP